MTTPPQLHRPLSAMRNRVHAAAARAQVARSQVARSQADRGALMAEYGILIFFVGIAGFGILVLFGQEVWELFSTTESEFDSSRQTPPAPD